MDGGGRTLAWQRRWRWDCSPGFYTLDALFAGLAALTAWAWLAFPGDQIAYWHGGVTAATAVGLLVPAWQFMRATHRPPDDGVVVDEAAAPGLWA